MKEQKKEERKPIEVEGIKEQEVEKILNKRKIRGVKKYLVCWKGFTVEHDSWERREDLGDAKVILEDFEGRMEVEIRSQIEQKNKTSEEESYQESSWQRCCMGGMMGSLKKNT